MNYPVSYLRALIQDLECKYTMLENGVSHKDSESYINLRKDEIKKITREINETLDLIKAR